MRSVPADLRVSELSSNWIKEKLRTSKVCSGGFQQQNFSALCLSALASSLLALPQATWCPQEFHLSAIREKSPLSPTGSPSKVPDMTLISEPLTLVERM